MSTFTPAPDVDTASAVQPQVKITGLGPNLVEGCKVYAPDGQLIADGEKCALCACGRTKNPAKLCDGSHKAA